MGGFILFLINYFWFGAWNIKENRESTRTSEGVWFLESGRPASHSCDRTWRRFSIPFASDPTFPRSRGMRSSIARPLAARQAVAQRNTPGGGGGIRCTNRAETRDTNSRHQRVGIPNAG